MPKRLLIGYWPLLNYSKFAMGAEYNPDGVVRLLAEAESIIPGIQGVLWLQCDDGQLMPVFIMERAREVAEHLIAWVDGDNDRFSLHIEERGGSYGLVLIPSVEKSIARWKLAHLMSHEEFVTDKDFTVYYHTLGVFCPSSTGYQAVRGRLGEKCPVGFIDVSVVDMANPQNSDFESVVRTGPFRIGPNNEIAMTHLNSLFDTERFQRGN